MELRGDPEGGVRGVEEARAVLDLQLASYAVEAEIIGSCELPPLWGSVEDLRSRGEGFHGYFLEGSLAGAISTKRRERILGIHRPFAGPDYFHRGEERACEEAVPLA